MLITTDNQKLTMPTNQEQFHGAISALTQPLNGQYPRPWMTELADPLSATVLVIGHNQTMCYDETLLTHDRHLDALFNRNGESCRGLYDELNGFNPSQTRRNTDCFRSMLAKEKVIQVLETNVVCYSTPMGNQIRLPRHNGGQVRGSEIFQTLLDFVKPRVLIAHGAKTRKLLGRLLGTTLPDPPKQDGDPRPVLVGKMTIFITPSLAPPQWNKWQGWAQQYLVEIAKAAARSLNQS
jgi:hypothetical protein